MNAIKRRFFCCLIGTVLCAGAAIWFAFSATWYVVIVFAVAAIILMLITIKMSERYQTARLISENQILNVSVASVSETGDDASESAVSVVVSGFGILMDGRPYKFGYGGVNLTKTTINRESITLFFGGEEKAYSVCLLHGLTDKAEVDKLADLLRYETGVIAGVSGW